MHWLIRLLKCLGNGSFLRRRGQRAAVTHYAQNLTLRFDGFIENQMHGPAAQILMGCNPLANLLRKAHAASFQPGYNACGWVAIYNALLTLGHPAHPAEIVRCLEQNRFLNVDGLFGTDPRCFAEALHKLGFRAQTYLSLQPQLDVQLRAAPAGILSIVNRGGVRNGAHNICLNWDAASGVYRMHNAGYSGGFGSLDDFLRRSGTRFLSLTILE